jgi:hypothetical protein
MLGVMEMLRRVFVFGRIAAPHVAAFQTEAQVNPGVAHFQTFLAAIWSARCNISDLIHMRTNRHKRILLYDRDRVFNT